LIPALRPAGHWVALGAQRALILTLFLIGANLSWKALKSVGGRPFLLGVALWAAVATGTLATVLLGWAVL
jgi:uncharacterized membrane protein YadS